MKDNFSSHSDQYKQFRPEYPEEVYEVILSHLKARRFAWDCGTGNGQVAMELSNFFQQVYATDISKEQLSKAPQKDNIIYKVESAETTSFPSHYFDLITVAQAIHWFDFELFYKEVKRVLSPEGLLAIMGYGLLRIDPKTDAIIDRFYKNSIGEFWDKERKYIDENYKTIPFPFSELTVPSIDYIVHWNIDQLLGYLNTWSAVKHYQKKHGYSPVNLIASDLEKLWGTDIHIVKFPQLLRLGHL